MDPNRQTQSPRSISLPPLDSSARKGNVGREPNEWTDIGRTLPCSLYHPPTVRRHVRPFVYVKRSAQFARKIDVRRRSRCRPRGRHNTRIVLSSRAPRVARADALLETLLSPDRYGDSNDPLASVLFWPPDPLQLFEHPLVGSWLRIAAVLIVTDVTRTNQAVYRAVTRTASALLSNSIGFRPLPVSVFSLFDQIVAAVAVPDMIIGLWAVWTAKLVPRPENVPPKPGQIVS
jgi:hypothetical protein